MKNTIAGLMFIGGMILGLYVGVYLMFIGGIVQVINALKASEILASPIAWGIAKVAFAGVTGFLSAYVLILPALAIFTLENKRRKN